MHTSTVSFQTLSTIQINALNLEQLPESVDPLNYIAIELLEMIGHIAPDEYAIDQIEAILHEMKKFFLLNSKRA